MIEILNSFVKELYDREGSRPFRRHRAARMSQTIKIPSWVAGSCNA